MRIFRSAKRKILYGVLGGAFGMLSICCIIGYFAYQKMHDKELELIEKYEAQIEELELIASNSEVAYAFSQDVEKGEAISEAMLHKVYIPKGAVTEDLIDLRQLKLNEKYVFFAKTDFPRNTIVTQSLLYNEENITNDMREGEYNFIEIPSNVQADSYIDVRIQFPTGDEYIVLSKKKVKNVTGITLQMNVAEGEILTLSSAVVDAYLEGARIYSVPYVDEHMQARSVMTYPVKDNVRSLILSSPNVVEIAKYHLEQQNRLQLENNLQSMSIDEAAKVEAQKKAQGYKAEEASAKELAEQRLIRANEIKEEQNLNGGE